MTADPRVKDAFSNCHTIIRAECYTNLFWQCNPVSTLRPCRNEHVSFCISVFSLSSPSPSFRFVLSNLDPLLVPPEAETSHRLVGARPTRLSYCRPHNYDGHQRPPETAVKTTTGCLAETRACVLFGCGRVKRESTATKTGTVDRLRLTRHTARSRCAGGSLINARTSRRMGFH